MQEFYVKNVEGLNCCCKFFKLYNKIYKLILQFFSNMLRMYVNEMRIKRDRMNSNAVEGDRVMPYMCMLLKLELALKNIQ